MFIKTRNFHQKLKTRKCDIALKYFMLFKLSKTFLKLTNFFLKHVDIMFIFDIRLENIIQDSS